MRLRAEQRVEARMLVQLPNIEQIAIEFDAGEFLSEPFRAPEHPMVLVAMRRRGMLEIGSPDDGVGPCENSDQPTEAGDRELGVQAVHTRRSPAEVVPDSCSLDPFLEDQVCLAVQKHAELRAESNAFTQGRRVRHEMSQQIEGRLARALREVKAERVVLGQIECESLDRVDLLQGEALVAIGETPLRDRCFRQELLPRHSRALDDFDQGTYDRGGYRHASLLVVVGKARRTNPARASARFAQLEDSRGARSGLRAALPGGAVEIAVAELAANAIDASRRRQTRLRRCIENASTGVGRSAGERKGAAAGNDGLRRVDVARCEGDQAPRVVHGIADCRQLRWLTAACRISSARGAPVRKGRAAHASGRIGTAAIAARVPRAQARRPAAVGTSGVGGAPGISASVVGFSVVAAGPTSRARRIGAAHVGIRAGAGTAEAASRNGKRHGEHRGGAVGRALCGSRRSDHALSGRAFAIPWRFRISRIEHGARIAWVRSIGRE